MGGEEGGPPRSTVGILVNCTQRRALDVARQTAWFSGNILGLSGSTLFRVLKQRGWCRRALGRVKPAYCRAEKKKVTCLVFRAFTLFFFNLITSFPIFTNLFHRISKHTVQWPITIRFHAPHVNLCSYPAFR